MEKQNETVYIWNDLVGLKDLSLAIGLSVITTMVGYFLAPVTDPTKQLFFGLAGAIVGFLITTFLIKPKRNIKIQK
ncbi:hypothetical protein [Vagococcus salmoninarum]|uniref:Uncharacterized protein n=1 Tax=Vagococcus salmoninarum TaxID=2739 RepID=A0A429ZV46_9ENTE|nr:hypothetical protein [Vagococcus salmoninarum]MBE9390383.1 hypothetical protein [Vagococcus salmoninarum]RST97512.1 hypothetical protein CBF35_02265 [Vagococcus salmoninarum]